jgi:hypothetical protein
MEQNTNQTIKGDRALSSGDEDRLGFREIARRIATSLIDRASEDGLVVGLEGAWGSGKSSLLYLITDELQKLPDNERPTVIRFQPWLIGNRDALIASLFAELSKQVDQLALQGGDATPASVAKANEAGEALRGFINGLSKAGAFIEFAGKASGLSLLEMAGTGLKAAGEATEEGRTPQLAELKEKLVKSLRGLDHRFIITIDDVDRLEPAEVIEVLRLVRSVVDLSNIVHLLCYDSDILAHSIEEAAKVKNGHAYLEKIVQLTVMVPQPEPLQLRQWFTDELSLIARAKEEDELSRLKHVIDYEGGRQLRTPRSVVRALDAIRFLWPPLREAKADLADLVWLQLIKDGNPALYRWIEDYCATAAVVSLGTARVDEAEKTQKLAALLAAVPTDHFKDTMYRHAFVDQLPGLEVGFAKKDDVFRIFEPVTNQDRDDAIRRRRLASPDHYRIYFALAGPSHALSQEDFTAMWATADANADKAGAFLLQLNEQHAVGSLTKADIVLERIKSGAHEVLSPTQSENLLLALSHVMDEIYRTRGFDLDWINTTWDRAQDLIPMLLSRLTSTHRAPVIKAMFTKGTAIGWLTGIFRDETFAHGRYGQKRRTEDEWLFKDPELDQVTELMVARYQAMSASDLLASPRPISVLFAWLQGGDEEGPRKLLEMHAASDEGLVEILEHLFSRGKFQVLRRENVEPFMDYGTIKLRLGNLANHPQLGIRSKKLLDALIDGEKY